MSITFDTKTYTADSISANQVGYAGPAKTVTLRDDLKLSRQFAKPTSTFSGIVRTNSRLVRTLALTNALTPSSDGSLSVDSAIPIGASDADIEALVTSFAALVASAEFLALCKAQTINH